MRSNIISPISDSSRQITDLQRRSQYLTLTDSDRDNRTGIPTSPVHLIVELTIRNEPSLLPRKIDSQLIAIPHRNHIILPNLKSLLYRRISLPAVDHIMQSPREKRVTRGRQRPDQIQRRRMPVTSRLTSPEGISMRTGILSFRSNHPFLQEDQTLSRFKCRSGRILRHERAVE